jgi:hypothetical protein
MNKCLLCKKNDADKEGSHIVPHFILKRIENIEGKSNRDYELGFTIEGLNVSSHFGRSVQPEKLEEVYGEITEEDIAKNRHPLIVDNFFCANCENRLSIIENEYSKIIDNALTGEYESGVSAEIGTLFWGSILWRMSINEKSGVKLTEAQNEHLRKLLDTFLPTDINILNTKSLIKSDLVKSISYKLIRCSNLPEGANKWISFHPELNNPL